MRKVQLTILFLNFLLTRQPKYRDCARDLTEEKEYFCANYESLSTVIILAAVVLSAILERCEFKKSTFGLLAANSLLALFRMQNTNYLILSLLEEFLSITSMILHNLTLISILDRSSLRQKSVMIAIYRILQILSTQVPSLIFHSSYEAKTGFRVAISLLDFASASCLAMAFLKNFSDNEYAPVHNSESEHDRSNCSYSKGSFAQQVQLIARSLPIRTICVLILIGILCDPVVKVINRLDLEHVHSNDLTQMSGLWLATELVAVIGFVVVTWIFDLRGVLITSMAVFTLVASIQGFIPISKSETELAMIPGSHKYLFFAELLSATILTMTCVLIIATSVHQGLRCFVLTLFTASIYAFWPLFNKLLEVFGQRQIYSPTFSLIIGQSTTTVELPFIHFAVATIIVLVVTLFVNLRRPNNDESVN